MMVISGFRALGLRYHTRDIFGLLGTGVLATASIIGTTAIGAHTLGTTGESTMASGIMVPVSLEAGGKETFSGIILRLGM
jgi:hypothetical protein